MKELRNLKYACYKIRQSISICWDIDCLGESTGRNATQAAESAEKIWFATELLLDELKISLAISSMLWIY